MLAGNVVALLSPLIFIPILTYAFGPQNYDFKSMAAIRLSNDSDIPHNSTEPEDGTSVSAVSGTAGLSPEAHAAEQKKLERASIIAKSMTAAMTLALLVLWPMPLYGSGYVFSKKFFTGWVTVGILWLFCSAGMVGIFPLWEGRHSMKNTFSGIVRDLTGKGGGAVKMGKGHGGDGSVIEGRDGEGEMPSGSGSGSEVGAVDEKKTTEMVSEKTG